MTSPWILLIGAVVSLFVLDRILRWMEGREWIYYRKTKPGRSAIGYHMLEMSSVFQPSFQVVQEIQVAEEKGEAEAGAGAGDSGNPDLRPDLHRVDDAPEGAAPA